LRRRIDAMAVAPSCQALLIHDDDSFRKSLIATMDQKHFAVTYAEDGDEAVDYMQTRKFSVILVAVDLKSGKGLRSTDYLATNRSSVKCGVIILGEPDPQLRTFAPWADETLLKPVDPEYVATRARVYCNC
jgi:DNA-binding response OmpR family regulator